LRAAVILYLDSHQQTFEYRRTLAPPKGACAIVNPKTHTIVVSYRKEISRIAYHETCALDGIEMNEPTKPICNFVIGPDGRRLTLADLPMPDTIRWVARRKAEVVVAVQGGLLSLDEACSRYALDRVEFLTWQDCFASFGLVGLRTTRTQRI
jgi:hypothetical protein